MGSAKRRGNGEGSITQRADGRWEGRLDLGIVNGKRKRISVYGQTRREVQEKLRHRRAEFDSHGMVLDQRLTVGKWLDHWVSSVLPIRVASGNLAQSTFANYADCVRLHLKPAIGHIRLAQLSPSDVDQFIAAKRQKVTLRKRNNTSTKETYSSNSLRLMRSTLRKALKDAQHQGLVPRNVAALSEPVHVVKRAQSWLTEDGARALLKQVQDDRLGSLYIVCLSLGLRRGEVLGLTWPDVDFDHRTIYIGKAVKRVQTLSESGPRTRLDLGPTKTQSSNRTQRLPQVCIDALKRHRARQKRERLASEQWSNLDLVFTTPVGSLIDPANFAKWLDKHCIAGGLGHRKPHELRHSAATILLAQGVPLHEVSEILGHSSISVTKDVYGHLTTERQRVAADAMDRVLLGGK